MNKAHGIPTRYAGIQFRSRTEARWAHLFDAIGWRWEYEPFEVAGYIPDFAILGNQPLLVEIKAHMLQAPLVSDALRVRSSIEPIGELNNCHVVIFGATPWCIVDNHEEYPGLYITGPSRWQIDSYCPVGWIECRGRNGTCGETAIYNTEDSYAAIPCGHWDGDHHLGYPPMQYMKEMWKEACNSTQWNPPT